MKFIKENLSQVILAIVAVAMIVSIVLCFTTPLGGMLSGIFTKMGDQANNEDIWELGSYTKPYTVTLKANIPEGGTVEFTSDGHSGTSVNLKEVTEVTMTATASAGYRFLGWYRGDTELTTSASYTTTVGNAQTFKAVFEAYLAPGLYETGTKTMLKSWDTLVSEGILSSAGMIVSGQEANLAGDLVISDTVTSIQGTAFKNCTALTGVEIPDTVIYIGQIAFRGCTSLESVTFAEGSQLIQIDNEAFNSCTSLTSIEIPASVNKIGISAFVYCTNLKTVYFDGTLEQWCNIEISQNPCYYGAALYINGELADDIKIPASVTSLSNAFTGCTSLTSVTFEEGSQLTSIGDSAFWKCTSLENIEIPDSVTTIGDRAFSGCTNLTSLEFPANLTSISSSGVWPAVDGCTNLKSITIHADTLVAYSSDMLKNCSALEAIYVPADLVETYKAASGWVDFADKIQAIS